MRWATPRAALPAGCVGGRRQVLNSRGRARDQGKRRGKSWSMLQAKQFRTNDQQLPHLGGGRLRPAAGKCSGGGGMRRC